MLRWLSHRLARFLEGRRSHPSREQLERFLLDGLPPEETSRVMRHLAQGCGRCREVTGSFWSFGSDPEVAAGERFEYGDAMSRAFSAARRARAELEAGEGGAARLELSLRRSREEAATDPGRAVISAGQAVAAAEALGERDHPAPVIADLRARAWGALAETRCLVMDLEGAEEALGNAREHQERGTGCRLGKARLLAVEAALREAQGRFDEAARFSRRAAHLNRREGGAVTLQSPATISANPTPSTQPKLSPRSAAASTTATRGCNVP